MVFCSHVFLQFLSHKAGIVERELTHSLKSSYQGRAEKEGKNDQLIKNKYIYKKQTNNRKKERAKEGMNE